MKKIKKNFAVIVDICILEDDTWSAAIRDPKGQMVGVCDTPVEVHDLLIEVSSDSQVVQDNGKTDSAKA